VAGWVGGKKMDGDLLWGEEGGKALQVVVQSNTHQRNRAKKERMDARFIRKEEALHPERKRQRDREREGF